MLQYFPGAFQENVIDRLVGRFVRLEAVERTVRPVVWDLAERFGIFEMQRVLFVRDHADGIGVGRGVEIAGNHGGQFAADFCNFFEQQLGAFVTGGFTAMVEVRIEVIKFFFW